jgi:heptosyltransferase-2
MKILIVQTSFIGDTILSTPVISGLKKIYPDSRLAIMTTPVGSGLFKNDPLIDEIILFDKHRKEKGLARLFQKAKEIRKKRFDKVYSLHRSYRTSLLLFWAKIPQRIGFSDAKLSFLYTRTIKRIKGSHAVTSNLSLLFGQAEEKFFDAELKLCAPGIKDLNSKTRKRIASLSNHFAVLAPGSAWKTKQWHMNGFFQVSEFLLEKGLDVILIGGKADKNVCSKISQKLDVIDLSGELPLSDTLYIIKNSRLLICNDSMALHMGSAFKIPTIVIFCATSPSFGFGPWKNPNAVIVENNTLACKPCRRHGSMKCPNNTNTCMMVSSQKVIQACGEFLD